jgi:hypothetical protein
VYCKFIKELNTFIYKKVKYRGTYKPKRDKLILLLVKGINRVSIALKSLLDIAYYIVSILYRRFNIILILFSKGLLCLALVTRRLT